MKIACGFGGGMGCRGEVCGAFTGGVIVIGLKYGRGEDKDKEAAKLPYAKTRKLMDLFDERYGTIICRKLLSGCNLTTTEGWKTFKENNLLNKICAPCVQSVVEILENIIIQSHAELGAPSARL